MDSKSLESAIKYNLAETKARSLGKKAAQGYLRAEAVEFGERYKKVLRGFEAIMSVSGYTTRPGPERISNPIILDSKYKDSVLGTSTLSARVSVDPKHFDGAHTYFYFMVGDKEHRVAQEWFTTIGFTLRGGTPFIDDETGAWINRGDGLYTRNPVSFVHQLGEELVPKVEEAEATQVLLWSAMQGPQRNWGMARMAQDAYRDLYAEALETTQV